MGEQAEKALKTIQKIAADPEITKDKIKSMVEHDFTIDHICRYTKKHYTGAFTCKVPTITERRQIEILTSDLTGSRTNISLMGHNLAKMEAYFSILLLKKPLWFNTDELFDEDLIMKVFDEINTFVNNFFREDSPEERDKEVSEVATS